MQRCSLVLLLLALSACGKATTTASPQSASVSASPEVASLREPLPISGSLVDQAVAVANAVRAKNGLPGFTIDPKLSLVAQAHADDMFKRHYFEHNSPEGETPFQRMDKAGVQYNAAAENIAMGLNDPEKVFELWLNSPGHRHNLLNKVYGRHGIGYAGGYWVHDFAD